MAGSIPTQNFSGASNYHDPFANLMRASGSAGAMAQHLNAMDKQQELDRQQGNSDRLFKIRAAEESRKSQLFNAEKDAGAAFNQASEYYYDPAQQAAEIKTSFDNIMTQDPNAITEDAQGNPVYSPAMQEHFRKTEEVGNLFDPVSGVGYKVDNAGKLLTDPLAQKSLLGLGKDAAVVDATIAKNPYATGTTAASTTKGNKALFDAKSKDLTANRSSINKGADAANKRNEKVLTFNKTNTSKNKGFTNRPISGEMSDNIKDRYRFGTETGALKIAQGLSLSGMSDDGINGVLSSIDDSWVLGGNIDNDDMRKLYGAATAEILTGLEDGSINPTALTTEQKGILNQSGLTAGADRLGAKEFEARGAKIEEKRQADLAQAGSYEDLLSGGNKRKASLNEVITKVFGKQEPVTPGQDETVVTDVPVEVPVENTVVEDNQLFTPQAETPLADVKKQAHLGTQNGSISNDGFIVDDNGIKSTVEAHPGETEATIIRKKRNLEIDTRLDVLANDSTTYKSKEEAQALKDERQFNEQKNALQYKMNPTGNNNFETAKQQFGAVSDFFSDYINSDPMQATRDSDQPLTFGNQPTVNDGQIFTQPDGSVVDPGTTAVMDTMFNKQASVQAGAGVSTIPNPKGSTKNEQNNNIGNLKRTDDNWDGMTNHGTKDDFVKFDTPEAGVKATAHVAEKHIKRAKNFEQYVYNYASEPKEKAYFDKHGKLPKHLQNYANGLAKSVGTTSKKSIPKNINMKDWLKTTARLEGHSGVLNYFTDDVIDRGLAL